MELYKFIYIITIQNTNPKVKIDIENDNFGNQCKLGLTIKLRIDSIFQ